MSLLEPGVLEPFSLVIRKHHSSRPDRPWYNSYEFRNYTATGLPDLITACNSIAIFESQLHRANTVFQSFTLSTWESDGTPYNPDTFITQPLTLVGAIPALDQAESLEICWRTSWLPQTGRQGFRLYRNCLSENDVTAPAGKKTLTNPLDMVTRLEDAIDTAAIGGFFDDGGAIIAFYMESTANARPILGVQSAGVTIKKLDNKYFDRP